MSTPPSDASPDPSSPPPEPPDPSGLEQSGSSGPRGPVLLALTALVVAVLVAPVLVAVVHAATGSDDDGAAAAPSTVSPAPASPAPASPSPASPSASLSAKASRLATCWDGSSAPAVSDCPEPAGVEGLTYVFPSIAGQRCGKPTTTGRDGATLRLVCRARADGGRATVVYAQWATTDQAATYLQNKGLRAAPGRGSAAVRRFVRPAGPPKAGAVYVDEPFTYIATLPAGTDPATAAGQVVTARPAKQVRGSRR